MQRERFFNLETTLKAVIIVLLTCLGIKIALLFNPKEKVVIDNGHLTYEQQLETLEPDALVIRTKGIE